MENNVKAGGVFTDCFTLRALSQSVHHMQLNGKLPSQTRREVEILMRWTLQMFWEETFTESLKCPLGSSANSTFLLHEAKRRFILFNVLPQSLGTESRTISSHQLPPASTGSAGTQTEPPHLLCTPSYVTDYRKIETWMLKLAMPKFQLDRKKLLKN